jgi:hypothetical protein
MLLLLRHGRRVSLVPQHIAGQVSAALCLRPKRAPPATTGLSSARASEGTGTARLSSARASVTGGLGTARLIDVATSPECGLSRPARSAHSDDPLRTFFPEPSRVSLNCSGHHLVDARMALVGRPSLRVGRRLISLLGFVGASLACSCNLAKLTKPPVAQRDGTTFLSDSVPEQKNSPRQKGLSRRRSAAVQLMGSRREVGRKS